jgi:hypothetical protein
MTAGEVGAQQQQPSPQQHKRDWLTIIIIVAPRLLGSGLIVTLLGTFVADLNKPNIQIEIIPDPSDRNKTAVEMSNAGRGMATHVKLTIKTPESIKEYPYFSTENITLSKVTPTLLEGYIPRFAPGVASFIAFNLTIDGKPNRDYSKGYHVYATYNEGSAKGGITNYRMGKNC